MAKAPDPSRDGLVKAVARLADAKAELQAVRDAKENARTKKWAAARDVEKAKAAKAGPGPAEMAASFIEAMKTGRDYALPTLPRQGVDEAEAELDRWRAVEAAVAAQIPDREQEVSFASSGVQFQTVEAVKASGAVAELLKGLAELQVEVSRRRAALEFLRSRGMISEAEQPAALAALTKRLPSPPKPQAPGEPWTPPAAEIDPISAIWSAALERLQIDPNAPLPSLADLPKAANDGR